MGIFGFTKKNTKPCCAAESSVKSTESSVTSTGGGSSDGSVLVLGSGCAKCNQLEAAVRAAMEELALKMEIGHVTDFVEIAAYGVMSTPALVVNGRVVSMGKVLKKDEVKALLISALNDDANKPAPNEGSDKSADKTEEEREDKTDG